MAKSSSHIPTSVVTPTSSGGPSATGSASVTPPSPPNEVPSGDPAALAFESATQFVEQQQTELDGFFVPSDATKKGGVHRAPTDVVQAMGGLLKLVVQRPVYGAILSASTTAALVDRIETGEALMTALENLVASLKNTNQASVQAGYAIVRKGYNYAKHNDPGDAVVQGLLAPTEALFARRPRVQVAGDKVGATAVKKLKAQARVNKATTDATAAQANLTTLTQKILPGIPAPTTEPVATMAPSAMVLNVPTTK